MNRKILTIFSVIVMLSCTLFVGVSNTAVAGTTMEQTETLTVGEAYSNHMIGAAFDEDFTGSIPGITLSVEARGGLGALLATGTPTTPGTYVITSQHPAKLIVTVSLTVSEYTVSFSSNGGSNTPAQQTVNAGQSITLPSPGTRADHTFEGWYTAADGGSFIGNTGSSYTVGSSRMLYAHWSYNAPSYTTTINSAAGGTTTGAGSYTAGSNVTVTATPSSGYSFSHWLDGSTTVSTSATYSFSATLNRTLTPVFTKNICSITTSQGNASIVAGDSFSYTVGTTPSNAVVTVSGASWMSASGQTVYGVPQAPGTYNITITAQCPGYTNATQSFTLTVTDRLSFTSAPSAGFIIGG